MNTAIKKRTFEEFVDWAIPSESVRFIKLSFLGVFVFVAAIYMSGPIAIATTKEFTSIFAAVVVLSLELILLFTTQLAVFAALIAIYLACKAVNPELPAIARPTGIKKYLLVSASGVGFVLILSQLAATDMQVHSFEKTFPGSDAQIRLHLASINDKGELNPKYFELIDQFWATRSMLVAAEYLNKYLLPALFIPPAILFAIDRSFKKK